MTDRDLAGCALLPCPFCGGEAKRDDRTEYQGYSASESQSMGMGVSAGGFYSTTYAIQCGCGIRVQGNNGAFLVARWNRRAPSRDAERYRWIRANCDVIEAMDETLIGWTFRNNGCTKLDDRIDAWIKQSTTITAAEGETK